MSTLTIRQPDLSLGGQSRVLKAVRGWIDRGEVRVGHPLPTMRQVAESLEVDKGTVCRAMAQLQDDGLVRREGRRLHVVKPSAADQPTSGVLAGTVLVLTAAKGEQGNRRMAGWVGKIIEGLLLATHERHHHTMLVHPSAIGGEAFDRLIQGRPLGCIVIATGQSARQDKAMLARLRDGNVPAVLFGEEIHSRAHDMVTVDHVEGARLLTHWLADHGAKRILRHWPYRITRSERPDWLAHRDEGYESAARDRGLEVLPPLEYPRPELPDLSGKAYFDMRVRHSVGFLVDHLTGPNRCDAILTASDRFAYEAAAACRLLGLEPNKDVLIAGYDADWAQCAYRQWEPVGPAVTIEQDDAALGSRMVEVLLDRVAAPQAQPRFSVTPPRLVEVADSLTPPVEEYPHA